MAIEVGRYIYCYRKTIAGHRSGKVHILLQKDNSHHCDLNTEVSQIHFLRPTSARDRIPFKLVH